MITFELRTITPADAVELLENHNNHNRNLRTERAMQYAKDMREGRWLLSSTPIDIAPDGTLLNGQHRLWAVIESGLPQQFYFATNVDPRVQDVTDIGIPRSAADILAIGGDGIKSASTCTAIGSMILRYDQFPDTIWGSTEVPGKTRIVEWVRANAEIVQQVNESARLHRLHRSISKTVWGSLSFLVQRESGNADRWEDFYEGVATGANLGENDPRLALSRWAGNNVGVQKGSWGQQQRLGIYIKTWNAFVRDQPVRVLHFRRNELPMPKVI